MDLQEFVTETLRQIRCGIEDAQKEDGGDTVNASPGSSAVNLGGNLINCGDYGVLCRVDFDVAVVSEASGSGGAKLAVFGFGAKADGTLKSSTANRIAFSATVRLPDGDKTRAAEVDAERRRVAASVPRHRGDWLA